MRGASREALDGDRRQLVEVPAEDLYRHTAPCLLRPHVLGGIEAVAQRPAVGRAQCIRMQQGPRRSAQLINHVNTDCACQAVQLLLRLRGQAQPGGLQGVRHEQSVGGVHRPAARPKVVGRVVGLRLFRGSPALRSK